MNEIMEVLARWAVRNDFLGTTIPSCPEVRMVTELPRSRGGAAAREGLQVARAIFERPETPRVKEDVLPEEEQQQVPINKISGKKMEK